MLSSRISDTSSAKKAAVLFEPTPRTPSDKDLGDIMQARILQVEELSMYTCMVMADKNKEHKCRSFAFLAKLFGAALMIDC